MDLGTGLEQIGFNPRPTRGATVLNPVADPVSIHAPHTGSDRLRCGCHADWLSFNPRPPHGERLMTSRLTASDNGFNPRPPHGERRSISTPTQRDARCFNPRPPHGERLTGRRPLDDRATFQSTPPTRGATRSCSDCVQTMTFQSTPPTRGATSHIRVNLYRCRRVSIHAPHTGSDGNHRQPTQCG